VEGSWGRLSFGRRSSPKSVPGAHPRGLRAHGVFARRSRRVSRERASRAAHSRHPGGFEGFGLSKYSAIRTALPSRIVSTPMGTRVHPVPE
jgi:hypothetical protein